MHIGRHIVQELVFQFGEPRIERWSVPLTPPEQDEVDRHLGLRRAHDVSLVIAREDRLVVIRRRGCPEGAFRIPSGAIHPEESFLDGAVREAKEETGLDIEIDDYLLQVHVNFTCEDRAAKWTTHVMLARTEGEAPEPRDSREIESARWVTWRELIEEVNPRLDESGLGRLRYRARLHGRLHEIVTSASPTVS